MAEYPDTLPALLADMTRRLEALETSARARRTSVRGGLISILDDAGVPVVEIGVRADGRTGVFVYASDGSPMFEVDNEGGMSTPIIPIDWAGNPAEPVDGNGRKGTTSATWSTLWRSNKVFGAGDQLGFAFALTVPGGTTVDLRLRAVETGGATPQTLWTVTGVTAATNYTVAAVTIPASCTIDGVSVLGKYLNLSLDMQRTAGAGTAYVAPIEQARIYPA